jgi:hypothetical protein
MGTRSDIFSTLTRLLNVKKALGLSALPSQPSSEETPVARNDLSLGDRRAAWRYWASTMPARHSLPTGPGVEMVAGGWVLIGSRRPPPPCG